MPHSVTDAFGSEPLYPTCNIACFAVCLAVATQFVGGNESVKRETDPPSHTEFWML